ncbi:MAG: ABC transporter ATP-binding protein [Actinomycetia bacterium]|nr:ABC transporter ATP-binding protein [Actinomycetes bacterium]
MIPDNALEVRGLCKSYELFSIENVSFDVPVGCITGFIGPNGAGKTTTIRIIMDMTLKDAGSVRLFRQEKVVERNTDIGVVMDVPFYNDDWTVRDIERGIAPFYPHWDSTTFSGYLGQFGILQKKKVKELSRGMKVKLQIAVALSHGARMLMLDEPTSGLDPVARDEVCYLLPEFASGKGKAVMFSTHITSDLEKVADRIVFILNGGIVCAGDKDALLGNYVLVTGSPDDVDVECSRMIIGYRCQGPRSRA